MNQQLKQLQLMQAEMEKTQAELAEKELTTTAGGGAVEVTMNGKKEITKLTIDKDVVDPDDVEMLQDLVMAAVNEAIRQGDETAANAMNEIAGPHIHQRAFEATGNWRQDGAARGLSHSESD